MRLQCKETEFCSVLAVVGDDVRGLGVLAADVAQDGVKCVTFKRKEMSRNLCCPKKKKCCPTSVMM